MASNKNLEGSKFGRLTVQKLDRKDDKSQTYWACICECGTNRVVLGHSLVSGKTKSCGCYGREQVSKSRTTHGATKGKAGTKNYHPLYGVWTSMKARCFNENHIAYKDYGGRGITVCKSWSSSFYKFKIWCEANGYKKGLVIDRYPDNNGDYRPGNCRFVSQKVNIANRRNTINISHNGVTKSMVEWAEVLGIRPGTLHARIYDYGYSLEKALTGNIYRTNGQVK